MASHTWLWNAKVSSICDLRLLSGRSSVSLYHTHMRMHSPTHPCTHTHARTYQKARTRVKRKNPGSWVLVGLVHPNFHPTWNATKKNLQPSFLSLHFIRTISLSSSLLHALSHTHTHTQAHVLTSRQVHALSHYWSMWYGCTFKKVIFSEMRSIQVSRLGLRSNH